MKTCLNFVSSCFCRAFSVILRGVNAIRPNNRAEMSVQSKEKNRVLERIDFLHDTQAPHPPLVATLGFFDGVHIGHRFLIEQVKKIAGEKALPSAVITFPVHPRKVLQQDYQPKLLCGYDEKLVQLAGTGVDYCVSLPFTEELSKFYAEDFMRKILNEKIGVDTLLIGYDHRFGRNREEGFTEYKRYGEALGVSVIQAEELRFEGSNVSSSQIRRLLGEGDIAKANKLLSYPYTISGKIVEGYKLGRTFGFPTANLNVWERYKVIPRLGVYAVLVHLPDGVHKGMLYIGTRPTLHNNSGISVEVNIFDFSGDLYNQPLTVEFIDFVRADKKFDDVDTLVRQIHRDKEEVINRLQ
jgi:riboflavin kinase/FMN adenylyltransferase